MGGILAASAASWAQGVRPEATAQPVEDAATWIERLGPVDTRDTARDKLRDLGAAAVGALVSALKKDDPVIRSESAFVLGRIGRREAVPSLIEALSDVDARVRSSAAYALGEIADAKAVDPLVRLLFDAEADVRGNACFALGHIPDASGRAAPELVKALADPDENVRNLAASALGGTKEPKALPALAWSALNDKSPGVRALAAVSMGALGDRRACATLVSLLDDGEYVVRARAIEGLLALTPDRRGYEARESAAARAAAVGRWKAWLARQKAAPIEPLAPVDLYEHWPGRPQPLPLTEPAADAADVSWLGAPAAIRAPAMTFRLREAAAALAASPAANAFFTAGRRNAEAGEFAAAAQAFDSCVKLAPVSREAAYNLALCRRKQDKRDEAISAFQLCLGFDPRDAECAAELAATLEAAGRAPEAEALYRQAIAGFGDASAAKFNLAERLMREGKVAEPLRFYETLDGAKTLPREIDRGLVKVRLATCHRRYGDAPRAISLLDDATAVTTDAGLVREAARQFAAMKRYDRAKALLEKSYEMARGDAESAWMLAAFLLRAPDETMRDPARAGFYAEIAVTARPGDERVISMVAEAAWACGQKEKAAEILEKALKSAPSDALRKQLEDYRKSLAPVAEKADDAKGEIQKTKPAEQPAAAPGP